MIATMPKHVFNVPIAPASLAGISFSPALPADTTVTVVGAGIMGRTVRVSGPTPLMPLTQYTMTISNQLTDTFGQPLPQPVVIRFTTGP